MAWFEHDGQQIYLEEEGEGSPVLFLPGWSESIDEFRDLRTALALRHRVIAADLPGSGRSTPQPRVYSPSYYQEDARTFLALLEGLDAVPAHVVGFSDGGETALVMAARTPTAIRSVVAWGAAGSLVTPAALIDAFENVVDAPIEPLREFAASLVEAYGPANARAMSASVARAWRAIAAGGGDICRASAGAIGSPVLLITGESDAFAPPEVVAELSAAIPRSEWTAVGGAGHVLHLAHGQWLAVTIAGWLARHGG